MAFLTWDRRYHLSSKSFVATEHSEGIWHTVKTIGPMIWPTRDPRVRTFIAFASLTIIVQRLIKVVLPWLIGEAIEILRESRHFPWGRLIALGVCHWLDTAVLARILYSLEHHIKQHATRSISKNAFDHAMRLSLDYHSHADTTRILEAISDEGIVETLIDATLYKLGPAVVDVIVGSVYIINRFDMYTLGLWTLSNGTFLWLGLTMTSRNAHLQHAWKASNLRLEQVRSDSLKNWNTAASFDMIEHECTRHDRYTAEAHEAAKLYYRAFYVGRTLQDSVISIAFSILITYHGHKVWLGSESLGAFYSLITRWDKFCDSLSRVSKSTIDLQTSVTDSAALLELFAKRQSVYSSPDAEALQVKTGLVEFRGVKFSYKSTPSLLNSLTFTVQPGQMVALVGASGAGKSTIFKLLQRFYDVDSGNILIDGQDISKAKLASLRNVIGVVPQEATFFSETIDYNVRYGNQKATEEQLEEAYQTYCIDSKIHSLPDGGATLMTKAEAKFSGGERQRLSIARTTLSHPKILLLDEPTSSIDATTERLLIQSLKQAREGCTTLVIAHRLNTIRHADWILVLKDGHIVESGTHDVLMTKPAYSETFRDTDSAL